MVAAFTCRYRFVGTLGLLRFRLSNPLKAMALAVGALQIWCLLTPRLRSVIARVSRFSPLQFWLLAAAIEATVAAAVGILVIDLQWGWAAGLVIVKPRLAATVAFCFAAMFLCTVDDRWQRVRAALPRFQAVWRRWSWGSRGLFLLVLLHGIGVTKALLSYWEQTSSLFLSHQPARTSQFGQMQKWNSTFDRFCDDCCHLIPINARVLYHGPTEGLQLASNFTRDGIHVATRAARFVS